MVHPAATAEAWVDGHLHAFAFFGRVSLSVLYDNDRCLVARFLLDGKRKRTTLFIGCCRLNPTPRKRAGSRAPAGAFREKLLEQAA